MDRIRVIRELSPTSPTKGPPTPLRRAFGIASGTTSLGKGSHSSGSPRAAARADIFEGELGFSCETGFGRPRSRRHGGLHLDLEPRSWASQGPEDAPAAPRRPVPEAARADEPRRLRLRRGAHAANVQLVGDLALVGVFLRQLEDPGGKYSGAALRRSGVITVAVGVHGSSAARSTPPPSRYGTAPSRRPRAQDAAVSVAPAKAGSDPDSGWRRLEVCRVGGRRAGEFE